MKSKIILNAALLILLALFWTCDKESIATSVKKEITHEIDPLCNEARGSLLPYEIDRACAETAIDAYEDYLKTVKSVLDSASFIGNEEKLIRGVKISRDEIQELANLLKADTTVEPYLMLALKGDSVGVYADMIFTLQTGDGDDNTDYRYFDFTQPCPTYCPKKYSKLPR